MALLKDFSASAVIAGFVTVLVGFTSSAVIVFQAAQALQASPTEIGSWMFATRLRESALVTFLVTASGVTLFGIGSAFWGLVVGALSLVVLQANRRHV